MVEEFRRRRDLVVAGLNALPGVSCRVPRGAFYVFPDVSQVPIPPQELADRLLEEAGVALLAGAGFGVHGERNLRISYANSRPQLELALDRIGELPQRVTRSAGPRGLRRIRSGGGQHGILPPPGLGAGISTAPGRVGQDHQEGP